MKHDGRPADLLHSIFSATAPKFDTEPAQGIARPPIALVDDDRCRFRLDDRNAFEALARRKGFERIERDLAPFAKEPLPRSRDTRHSRCNPRTLPVGRHLPDRGNARVDKHNLLAGRGIGVKLFMSLVKTLP